MIRLLLIILKTLWPLLFDQFKSRKSIQMENRLLKLQLSNFKRKQARPAITNEDRIFWMIISKIWKNWQSSLIFVSPKTIVKWHRRGFKYYWTHISHRNRKKGRPWKNKELRNLIRQMAFENITWGAPRIHGELLKLGLDVSERTVSRYMPKREPNQNKIKNWKKFFENHIKGICAMDFLSVPTITFRQLHGFFIISHERRKIVRFGVTYNPSASFVLKHLECVFKRTKTRKYLLFDRGSYFGALIQAMKNMGIKPVRTSFRSPWQNGIAERWVGNFRRDVLDHVIIINKNHLLKLMKDYVDYYNNDRTHYSLNKDSPAGREILHKPDPGSKIISLPRCGGLHQKYIWKKSA